MAHVVEQNTAQLHDAVFGLPCTPCLVLFWILSDDFK